MKILKLLIFFIIISSCKEKTFADDIVLSFPKNETLTFQEFNDDLSQIGTSLIYIGESSPQIEVKYYKYVLPPPTKINKNTDRNKTRKKFEDSVQLVEKNFFKTEKIQILETTETFSNPLKSENLSIIVREKDTIPLYKQHYKTKGIRKYKAFPIFIKNISTKVLKIPTDAKSVDFWILNNKQFQYIRNSNYQFVGEGGSTTIPYFELKPDEILVYAFPYFKKGEKSTTKIKFNNAESKKFEMSIDENIIKKLHEGFIE